MKARLNISDTGIRQAVRRQIELQGLKVIGSVTFEVNEVQQEDNGSTSYEITDVTDVEFVQPVGK